MAKVSKKLGQEIYSAFAGFDVCTDMALKIGEDHKNYPDLSERARRVRYWYNEAVDYANKIREIGIPFPHYTEKMDDY